MEGLEDQEQSEEDGEVDSVHSEEQPSSLLPSLEEKSRSLSKRQRKTVGFEPVRVNLSLTSSPCVSPVWLIFYHETPEAPTLSEKKKSVIRGTTLLFISTGNRVQTKSLKQDKKTKTHYSQLHQ